MDQYPPSPIKLVPRLRDEHDPVLLKPIEVVVVDGKLDKALRKLRKKMAAEGVLKELKKRRRASKPSERKRRKQVDAARRRRKRERAAAKRQG